MIIIVIIIVLESCVELEFISLVWIYIDVSGFFYFKYE